jgi:hypothetical protein
METTRMSNEELLDELAHQPLPVFRRPPVRESDLDKVPSRAAHGFTPAVGMAK